MGACMPKFFCFFLDKLLFAFFARACYNRNMFKRKLAIFPLALALCGGIAGAYTAGAITASATGEGLTAAQAELFLPAAYEQYLALNTPSDIALCDDYLAIADGNLIYVYDREAGEYRVYQHGEAKNLAISKIQFSSENRLYFSDTAMEFYELNLTTMQKGEQKLYSLSAFYIFGDMLFAASTSAGGITDMRMLKLDGTSEVGGTTPFVRNLSGTPLLYYEDGALYYTVNDTVNVYRVDSPLDSDKFFLDKNKNFFPKSICTVDDKLYFTDAAGLYRSDMDGASAPLIEGEGFSALTVWKDKLYCVKGNAVREYELSEGGALFTGYEICAASSSAGRLTKAVDTVRAGNLLVTADSGNDRISVYDSAAGKRTLLPLENVSLVATDGSVIAAAAGDTLYLYEKNIEGVWGQVATQTHNGNDVTGVACVHGSVYYVTSAHHYGKMQKTGGEWQCMDVTRDHTSPKALAANLYGDLYVVCEGYEVRVFTEANFTDAESAGEKLDGTLPTKFSSLRAGFDGTLYYLDETKRLCSLQDATNQTLATIDGNNFVYHGGSVSPTTFALGFEDDSVYFAFDDFMVKTGAGELGFATLESVSRAVLAEMEEDISAVKGYEDAMLVEVNAGAIGVRVDLSALDEAPCYIAYVRTAAQLQGVLLAETDTYSLVALYENREYVTQLFRKGDTNEPTLAETASPAQDELYLSSDCHPFYFPCIVDSPARAAETLARGTLVKVIAIVRQEAGFDFAYIEYATPEGAAHGYVPLNFLTEIDPAGREEDAFLFGYLKKDTTFTREDGTEVTLKKGTQVKLYRGDDGTYTARFSDEEGELTATLARGDIRWGESDAWRIALIVGLTVLCVVIVGAYVYLLPRKKKK